MNGTVVIDWKFSVALGATAVGITSIVKMNSADVKEVAIHAIDACKELAVALCGDC